MKKQNISLTPPLAFHNQPIRALIDPSNQIWLNAGDVRDALQINVSTFLSNMPPPFWKEQLIENDDDQTLIAIPAVYRMMYFTTPLIDPGVGLAFDKWLTTSLVPALLKLRESQDKG